MVNFTFIRKIVQICYEKCNKCNITLKVDMTSNKPTYKL